MISLLSVTYIIILRSDTHAFLGIGAVKYVGSFCSGWKVLHTFVGFVMVWLFLSVRVLRISITDLLLIQRNLFQALYYNKNADCKG